MVWINRICQWKIYDTLFGDLVSHIIANAIPVNIIIVTETESCEYLTQYVPCNRLITDDNVVIYKKVNIMTG